MIFDDDRFFFLLVCLIEYVVILLWIYICWPLRSIVHSIGHILANLWENLNICYFFLSIRVLCLISWFFFIHFVFNLLLCIWKTSMYTTVGHFFFYFVVKSFGLKSKRMFPISSNIITNTISVSVMWINAIFVVITMRCSSVPGIDLNHWIKWFALQPIFYFWQTVRILSIDCGWHQIGSICAVHSLVMVCRWTCTYMPCLNETHRELEKRCWEKWVMSRTKTNA